MCFSELKRSLGSISSTSTILSERLQQLEREELVAKRVHESVPPRVEYSLTAGARELDAIMKQLDRWYIRWKAAGAL
jgi:DNA-binding HxlR family transcriptional regulator